MLSFLLALGTLGSPGPIAEAPFADLTFDQALAEAGRSQKIVLIDFFTTWCAPCKKLDQTTWKDPGVQKWLGEKTVALKLDAEKEKELAGKFEIEAYPTIVFVRPDGQAFDRIVGYRDPEAFLSEASDALAGKDEAARERDQHAGSIARAREKLVGHENDPMARGTYADALARAGRHEEALAEYLWCFDHGLEHQPAYRGVRLSFLLSDIAALGKEYPPAIRALEERRDQAEAALRSPLEDQAARERISEVVRLNQQLVTPQRILSLHDELRGGGKANPGLLRMIAEEIPELFLEARRHADLVQSVGNVEEQVDRVFEMIERNRDFEEKRNAEADESHRLMQEAIWAGQVTNAAVWYEALLGVNESERAARVAERLIAANPSGAMYRALIERAAHAGQLDVARAWAERGRPTLPEKERARFDRAVQRILESAEDG